MQFLAAALPLLVAVSTLGVWEVLASDGEFGAESTNHSQCAAGHCSEPLLASSVQIDPTSVQITWEDGTSHRFNPLWLRERCTSKKAVDPRTKQPLKNPHELPEELLVQEAQLLNESYLTVVFSDGHESNFDLRRVRDEVSAFSTTLIQTVQYDHPEVKLWSGEDFKIRSFDNDNITSDEATRLDLVHELLTMGVALIRNVPQQVGEVIKFGEKISTLRATDWGKAFNVRTKPDFTGLKKYDLAYTPRAIGLHTDNPWRLPCPDFQLLHAINHCECLGEVPCANCSVMNYVVDSFYIAKLLKDEDPEAFKLMSEVHVRFENDGGDGGSALVRVAPHFEVDNSGQLRAVRFSAKGGQYAPPLELEKLQKFYKARRRFSQLAHEARNTIAMQFRPGDLLVMDNLRVLHARSDILLSDGERYVQGAYVDRDGLWLNYERWRRNSLQSAPGASVLGTSADM